MMKHIVFIFITIFLANSCLYSAFNNFQSYSVRAEGMGYAFTGLADDSSAIFINPAGIWQIKDVRILSLSYGNPFLGTSLYSGNNSNTTVNTVQVLIVAPIANIINIGVG